MPAELLIPLAIFVALAVMFALILRRVWLLIIEQRQLGVFRRSVRDLAGRVDDTLDSVVVQIDRLRRHQVDAASISGSLDRALEALPRYGEEARGLDGPPVTAVPQAAFVAEIDRAERALQMVEHGCAILLTVGGEHRHVEAETAIKRGFLNAVHAREAIGRHAADIEATRPHEEMRWLSRRQTTRVE